MGQLFGCWKWVETLGGGSARSGEKETSVNKHGPKNVSNGFVIIEILLKWKNVNSHGSWWTSRPRTPGPTQPSRRHCPQKNTRAVHSNAITVNRMHERVRICTSNMLELTHLIRSSFSQKRFHLPIFRKKGVQYVSVEGVLLRSFPSTPFWKTIPFHRDGGLRWSPISVLSNQEVLTFTKGNSLALACR